MAEADPTTASNSAGAPPEPSTPLTPAPGAEPGNEIANPVAKKYADEAAAERKARKELEAKLAKFEEAHRQAELAKLGETERLQAQYATLQEQHAALQAELQTTRLLREINRHAPSLNLIDPDAAMLMLQAGGALDYDDDGKPTNVAKLLEHLIAEKPYLVATNNGNGGRPAQPVVSSGGATNAGRSAAAPPAPPKADPKALYQQRRGLANPNLWKK